MFRIFSNSNRRYFRSIILIILCSIFYTIIYIPTNRINNSFSLFDFPSNENNFHSFTKTVRICCLILTNPKKLFTYTKAIHETWGPRCDQHIFITENFNRDNFTFEQKQFVQQLSFLLIKNISYGRKHLTAKVNTAFLYIHQYYLNTFDWYVKADDDTYIIVDNLRAFLAKQDTTEPVTFGYNFKTIVKGGYHSGGASYVLSREALKRWYRGHQLQHNTQCPWDGKLEDVNIGKCLRSQGVYMGDSIDEYGRERFHPLTFSKLFSGNVPKWMLKYPALPFRTHYNCCSDQTISFHYMTPTEQYYLDFLLYRFHLERSNDKY